MSRLVPLMCLLVACKEVPVEPPSPLPVPDGAKSVFYETQSWESGGGSTRLTLHADGRSTLTVTEEGRAMVHRRSGVVPEAEAKRVFGAALAAGIHVLKPIRAGYTDGSGVLVGAELADGEVTASIATSIPPEPDDNWLRYQKVAQVFAPLMKAATAPRLAIVAEWTEVKSGSRGPKVTFENVSAQTLVILPNLLRFEITGEGVQYVPFPGPPIDPHGRAFALAPGAERTVDPITDGAWKLPPGEHHGRARYAVDPKMADPKLPKGELWVGVLHAPPGKITIGAPTRGR